LFLEGGRKRCNFDTELFICFGLILMDVTWFLFYFVPEIPRKTFPVSCSLSWMELL
jgi:hypothetical protein